MALAKSNSYSFLNGIQNGATDLAIKSAYAFIGEEILKSFPIPKIPKELK